MDEKGLEWRPGSFSKNFSWGQAEGEGLVQLYRAIRLGFDGVIRPVERDVFRERVRTLHVPDLIPVNFFLFNYVEAGTNWIAVDELVFHALSRPHSQDFDKLAVFTLNLSMVGLWRGAQPFQRYPALWAKHFVTDVVHDDGGWRPELISADSIENFLASRMQFEADRPRKFATNLFDIYRRSNLATLRDARKEKWWGHAVFLALDRIQMDSSFDALPQPDKLVNSLDEIDFWKLTALPAQEGRIAAKEIADLYYEMGGPKRFSADGDAVLASEEKEKVQREILVEASKFADIVPVARVFVQAQRQSRDRRQVLYLKQLYDHQCAVCGRAIALDLTRKYSEAGHIRPVGKPFDGPDHLSNMLVFCPNHHKAFDYGALVLVAAGADGFSVKSHVDDAEVEGREFHADAAHNLNSDFISWHADYYRR